MKGNERELEILSKYVVVSRMGAPTQSIIALLSTQCLVAAN